jgi:3-oxoacyl-ACP reductase-like protein
MKNRFKIAHLEMAWIMGFIKHFDGRLKDGSLYVGWVDSKTKEPVVAMAYRKISLHRQTVPLFGH